MWDLKLLSFFDQGKNNYMKTNQFDGLERPYLMQLAGHACYGRLSIDASKNSNVNKRQLNVFSKFESMKDILQDKILLLLFRYCKFQDNHDAIMHLSTAEDILKYYQFESLYVPVSKEDEEQELWVVFKKINDPNGGVAVKIINDKVADIGSIDRIFKCS